MSDDPSRGGAVPIRYEGCSGNLDLGGNLGVFPEVPAGVGGLACLV